MADASTRAGPSPQPGPGDSPRAQKILAAVAVVALFILLAQFHVLSLLILVFAGILLAVLLRAVGDVVGRFTHLRRGPSMVLAMMVLVTLAVLGMWLLAPRLGEQFSQLAEQLPRSLESLRDRMERYAWSRYLLQQAPSTEDLVPASRVLERATGVVSTALDVVIYVLVTLFVGIYLASEPRLYTQGLVHLLPTARRARARDMMRTLEYTLRWWLIGQGISMLIIGTMTALLLWFLGIPLPLALGLLAGLFNFIPNFGPLIALVPALLLALAISPAKAAQVLVLYTVIQSLEGYVITPLVQRKAVLLPPALTITMQVLLGWLVGALGVMFAAPLTAAMMVIVKMAYVQDRLKDTLDVPGAPPPPTRTDSLDSS